MHTAIFQVFIVSGRVHVGLVTYSDDTKVRFSLTQYSTKQDVLHAVERLPYTRGRTNTASALQTVRENLMSAAAGDREDVPDVVVVFTDGESNVNERDTVPQAIQVTLESGLDIVD